MKQLKMSIVGLGTWGINHAKIYKAHPFAEVVGVCDLDKEKAKKVATELQISDYYTDYKEMLSQCDCDAVAIVTPDFAHADVAIEACNHKKHILLEKPLATTREDVFKIAEEVKKSGVRAMVDFHNRWSPPFNEVYQSIQNNELGEIQSAYFRLNDVKWVATDLLPWAAQSSILWFLGSHSYDTLQWLFNDTAHRVYSVSTKGVLKKMGVDTVDQYLTTIEFKNGGIAHMENGWITPNANPCVNDIKFTILGTEGMSSIDASHNNLIQKITDHKYINPDIIVKNSVFNKPHGFSFESIRTFVDCILTGDEFPISFEESMCTSLVILSIMKSAETRTPVEVDYSGM